MATVGSHQVPPFAGPVSGFTNRAADVLANDDALKDGLNAHDADAGVHLQSGTAAARVGIAVGTTAGWTWIDTDTRRLYASNGAAWAEAAYLPLAGGTVAGALTVSGATAMTGGVTITGALTQSGGDVTVGSNLTLTGTDDPHVVLTNTTAVFTAFLYNNGGVGLHDQTNNRNVFGYGPTANSFVIPVAALVLGSDPGGAQRLRVGGAAFITGRVLVGASDPGGSAPLTVNGDASVTGHVVPGGRVANSFGGTTVAQSTATLIATVSTAGVYLVTAYIAGTTFSGYVLAHYSGAAVTFIATAGNGLTFSASGSNGIAVTQTSTPSATVSTSLLRLA